MPTLKQKVVKGAVWALIEKLSTQVTTFVVTMVLARLLTPNDYGTVALLTIFISVSWVLIDCGLGQALVQKKDAADVDFNTVFYINLGVSCLLYAALFFAAPAVARFYHIPALVDLLRVLALQLIFNAIGSVQNAELSRKFLFNLSFRIGLIQSFTHAAVGIALAYFGYGPWAIVWATIATSVVGLLARWFIIAWRPSLMFSWQAAKNLFSFGWKLTLSSLIESIYSNLYGLLIGRIYTKADLAFVNKGSQIPSLAMDSINNTIMRVAFPAFSQLQDDKAKLREAMRRTIKLVTFVIFPAMTGLAVCAKEVILLLLGDQWLPAVPYLRIACFSFTLYPFSSINLQTITALGRSDIFLKLEVIKKIIGVTLLTLSVRHGVLTFMCVMAFVSGPLSTLVNIWPNRKLLGYTVLMQIRDVIPTVLLSVLMGTAVFGLGCVCEFSSLVRLVILSFAGVAIYASLGYFLKMGPAMELLGLLKPVFVKFVGKVRAK